MWHKVKWLTFWVSMVLWFGNFWGCAAPGEEQNYKSTAPERPNRFERYDSKRTVPVDDRGGTVYVADETPAPAAPAPATPAPATETPAPPIKPAETTRLYDPADAPVIETAPSLNGLDRSHWPKIKIGPDTGVTYHGPFYYKDYPADRPEPRVNFNDPHETQLESSLAGNRDHGLIDRHHALQLVSQPVKFGLDTILLPFRMFKTPPCELVTTP